MSRHRPFDDERHIELLKQVRVNAATNKNIVDGLFAANAFDGIKASQAWTEMETQDRIRMKIPYYKFILLTGGAFSFYQLARIGSLSKSGKFGAIFGAVSSVVLLNSIRSAQNKFALDAAGP